MNSDGDRHLAVLMARAQDGDRRAYQALLTEAAVLVRVFLRKRLRAADHVEDLVQETLLAIHHYRHTYEPSRPFAPWMYAIARHRLFDFAAKHRRIHQHEISTDAASGDFTVPDAIATRREALGWLQSALATLSRTQREVIQMLKLEGYSVAEVSRKTGLSPSSVKVTAHRGCKALRELV